MKRCSKKSTPQHHSDDKICALRISECSVAASTIVCCFSFLLVASIFMLLFSFLSHIQCVRSVCVLRMMSL